MIKTYKELREVIEALEIIKTPYVSECHIDELGGFNINNDMHLQPHEALRLGKFLVAFYKGA